MKLEDKIIASANAALDEQLRKMTMAFVEKNFTVFVPEDTNNMRKLHQDLIAFLSLRVEPLVTQSMNDGTKLEIRLRLK